MFEPRGDVFLTEDTEQCVVGTVWARLRRQNALRAQPTRPGRQEAGVAHPDDELVGGLKAPQNERTSNLSGRFIFVDISFNRFVNISFILHFISSFNGINIFFRWSSIIAPH